MGARAFRLASVGPILGRHPGCVPSQAEILADSFAAEGRTVRATSPQLNPVVRAADMFVSLLRWRRELDMVVVNVFSGRSFLTADLLTWEVKALRRSLVVVLHGGGLPMFRERYPRWVERVLRRADHIVAPSPFLASAFRGHGVPVSVIPNVIHLDAYEFRLRDRPQPRLLWMRAFSEIYRPTLAVEAFASLHRLRPDAILTMAGQAGPLLEPARKRAADLGISEHVCFPGFLDLDGKRRAFAEHDIFISTNRVDNTPVSAVEAAAAGLPIVACDVGGLADLFARGMSALLLEDAADLPAAVERVLTEPGLAARLSANGRKVAEDFDWPKVRDQWDALYQSVLSAAAR